jgi:hypothetical protein
LPCATKGGLAIPLFVAYENLFSYKTCDEIFNSLISKMNGRLAGA